jgi:hypothetical protein
VVILDVVWDGLASYGVTGVLLCRYGFKEAFDGGVGDVPLVLSVCVSSVAFLLCKVVERFDISSAFSPMWEAGL